MRQGSRLAADIGGTFTDVAHFDAATGTLSLGKSLSTPRHLVEGIANGVEQAQTRFRDAEIFLHGSTVAINTLLERRGARTALLVTEGFRDIYEIGRINRPDAYNLFFSKHVPLVERALRFEVAERLTADGQVLVPLDDAGVHGICDQLLAHDVEAVAILLLHCYANPAHELRVKQIVRQRLPHAFVTASHELSQEYREFERCSTAVANAYVGPIVSRYVGEIETRLQRDGFEGSFLLVQSTGGLYASDQARRECVRMLESGPAAGVVGAHALCHRLGIANAIAFDMGGTTAKAGVILDGRVLTGNLALVGGYNEGLPVQIPLVDVFEVGTGGGSIAEIDHGGALRVGPRSAGADPGPACYGRGGTAPTVTDANLVLGRLSPERFLGGQMPLDVEAAHRAIETAVAVPLGLGVQRAAEGILRIAATKMSYAVKGVSTERGLDAASFTLIAYGGAGPLHASSVAREIGMKHLIIPRAPGHFCAFGMLHSDLRYDYVRTTFKKLEEAQLADIMEELDALARQGREALAAGAVSPSEVCVTYSADMRYVGQEHSVTVELDEAALRAEDKPAIKTRFDQVHQQRYGTCAPAEPVEIVTLRAATTGVMPKPPMERIEGAPSSSAQAARIGERRVYFSDALPDVSTPVYRRDLLLAGHRLQGPALIEEHASTTVVFPDDGLTVDEYGNLHIELGASR
ncbi:MAG: hydantoinase/oxoprolinase family protein [Pigmentiphaga sp.]|uniref:hydantoinase/oxoprolinase family protein n=1 Tax=Pigmentiphaga sp. TaxID=1977564 RepID=UPI0029A286AB|nr:hydantoinase/oxoprolinase family protein [Pigmentiphaga sp.]MDX3905180.1 hydantoinase/oxoprolinase family protein [Pigmentiphaga sp.]